MVYCLAATGGAVNQLTLRKPLGMLLDELKGEHRLRRVLGPVQLTALGVGAIIGAGIFVLTGVAAHDRPGPALMLSFVVAGITCVFAALCYAEFASMVPVAGSAYTYAYATLGELFAWIIGWDLVLEYAVASCDRRARLVALLPGLPRTSSACSCPLVAHECARSTSTRRPAGWCRTGSLVQPARRSSSSLLVTVVLVIGIRESAALQRRRW